jgi:hypothetical protein
MPMRTHRKPPDRDWMPFLKMGFGYLLLLTLGTLAGIIGIGHVEAKTSYGLDIILGGFLTLAGAFSGWAFKEKFDSDRKE